MTSGSTYTIGGDLNGVLIDGHNNNVMLQVTFNGDGGSRVSDYAGPRPVPVRRGTISLLPRTAGPVIGRDRELAELGSAVGAGGTVQVFGAAGIGKSALLRYAARNLGPGHDGVVFLSARDRDVAEIAQEIFRACYDASGYMPSAVELQQLLQNLRLRIYLDDLVCSASDLKELMDVLQNSALVFTARKRIPVAAVRTIPIGGLDESAAVNLLARHMPRSLSEAERTVALTLLSALDASPRDLQRIAAAGQRTLPERKQLPVLLSALLKQQPPEARDVLHLIESAGGDLAAGHLDAVLRRHDSEAVCRALAHAGLLTESEAGYRIPEDVEREVRRIRPVGYPVEVLCRHFTAWAGDPATGPDTVADHHRVLDTLVVRAEQEGHPDLGVALALAAGPKLQASLRFTAWGTLLGAGWSAAEKAGDKKAKAYFMHEEGIRCLLTHKLTPAALLLTEAVVLWQELNILAQMRAAHQSAQLAASQSITGSGAHAGIGATAAHAGGHSALAGSAQAHMAGAAVHAHAHVAGVVVQAAHAGSVVTATGTALPATITMPGAAGQGAAAVGHGTAAAGHAATVAGHGGAAGLVHVPSVFIPPGHAAIAAASSPPALPAPVHSAPIVKPIWHAPGASHSSTAGTAHGSVANGHAAVGHHAVGAGHTTAGHHAANVAHHTAKTVFHPGGASGVHGAAAASHSVASGAVSTTAAGTSGTAASSSATVGLGAVKSVAVGLTLCAAVAGGVAIVHHQDTPAPTTSSTSTVDPVCASVIPEVNSEEASVDADYNSVNSAVEAYNSSVSGGGQGDWGPAQSAIATLSDNLNQMGQTVRNARSQASDSTLVSALTEMSGAISTWSQNVQAYANRPTTSVSNSPSTFNEAADQINQVCN